MIRIEIEGFMDLMTLIKIFKHADDAEIKNLTDSLKESTQTLVDAVKKDANAGTGSN